MANWARTDYRIEGNQKDLQEIYNLCKRVCHKSVTHPFFCVFLYILVES